MISLGFLAQPISKSVRLKMDLGSRRYLSEIYETSLISWRDLDKETNILLYYHH